MNLKKLEKRLTSIGYLARIHLSEFLRVGMPLGEQEGIPLFDLYCDIYIVNNELEVYYGNTNVRDVITFRSEVEVVKWVKKQYPI